MDILRLLTESSMDLYSEDLDFFETELATNDTYSETYLEQCKEKIRELRAWMNGESSMGDDGGNADKTKSEQGQQGKGTDGIASDTPPKKTSITRKTSKGIIVGIHDLAPEEANPAVANMTPSEQVKSDIDAIRMESNYKSLFKKYVKESQIIDQNFLEKHFSYFQQWEVDAIVSVKSLEETFLEKYFGAIDHEKIARYQLFSESFFIKHYSQMNPETVLKHGRNEWRHKEKRTKQLDVFLRLKGIKY